MKKYMFAALGGLTLAACGGAEKTAEAPETPPAETTVESEAPSDAEPVAAEDAQAAQLQAAIDGDWRDDAARARDEWRNPAETLTFFGVEPDDTVIEIWPGRGWYSNILAPYLNSGGGKLVAVVWDIEAMPEDRRERYQNAINNFKSYFEANSDLYGTLEYSALSETSGPLGEAESADVVLTFRNVHNWMASGYEAKVFDDAFAVLKSGGVLGVVEHRLPSSDDQDPAAKSGYVHEDYVKALATNAGFEFAEASEVNANPADTADHPFGVWTLPPVSRTQDGDGNAPEGFDPEHFKSIGESDRMTLKFVKPVPAE